MSTTGQPTTRTKWIIDTMNDYQKEQLEAFTMVTAGLTRMNDEQRGQLRDATAAYMQFRQTVDRFLDRYFKSVCTHTCYRSRTSACCSKDGILTFFADAVVNAVHAPASQMERLLNGLGRVNTGHRCIYLGEAGCIWTVRPVVCAMFLCDQALNSVFDAAPEARPVWERLREKEKRFKWPDRPVLFDYLEQVFLELGYRSTLMHLNLSPGLLRVKRNAGLIK